MRTEVESALSSPYGVLFVHLLSLYFCAFALYWEAAKNNWRAQSQRTWHRVCLAHRLAGLQTRSTGHRAAGGVPEVCDFYAIHS